MKQTLFPNIAIIFVILLLPGSINAIEGMSPEEYALREEHDRVKKELYSCFALNNVDPTSKIDESVCKDEQREMRHSMKIFNKFMRENETKAPYKVSKNKYKEYMKKYSSFTEDELKDLHEENCTTKWGSSGSSECNAIAESLARMRYQRLQSE